MERLTKVMICPDGTKIYDISNKLFGLNVSRGTKMRMILEKLAAYEDAEEQGLLLRLPCKVGDVAYVITHNAVKKEIVRDVQYRGHTYAEGQRWFINIGAFLYCENDIGKTVFLTQEEAKVKLKELEG